MAGVEDGDMVTLGQRGNTGMLFADACKLPHFSKVTSASKVEPLDQTGRKCKGPGLGVHKLTLILYLK